jgi:hypothetical protein
LLLASASARTSDWAMVQMADVSRDGAGPFLFLEPEEMVRYFGTIEYFWIISTEERETCLVGFLGQIFKRPSCGIILS